MRCWRLFLLFSLSVVLLAGIAGPAQAIDPNDNFDDGVIDAYKWWSYASPDASLIEAGGKVVMSLPAPGLNVQADLTSTWVLSGAFDFQVDYELIQWPTDQYAGLGLLANLPYDNCSVQRASVDWGGPSQLYLTDYLPEGGGDTVHGIIPTTDTSGTLRLVRDESSVLTAYVLSPGATEWTTIYSAPAPAENMRAILACWSGGATPITIAFDNFRVNSGTIPSTVPTIRDVQIDRGKDIDSFGWTAYHERLSATMEVPDLGGLNCVKLRGPAGWEYTISICGGRWESGPYDLGLGRGDAWYTQNDDGTYTFVGVLEGLEPEPPAGPYEIEVVPSGDYPSVTTTPDAPPIPAETPLLISPALDSVIAEAVPTFEWSNDFEGTDNWLQLRAEGSTYCSVGPYQSDDGGQIWKAAVGDELAAVYNFYGSPQGPDLDPGRSYLWRVGSSRVDDDYVSDPVVRFTTTQTARRRFVIDAAWPALPELPGKLAYAGMMWGDGNGDFDSEMTWLYGTTPQAREWLSTDFVMGPNWSWDGSSMLYYRKDQGLWLDSLDGSYPYHIPVDAWGQNSWGPDNTRVAYGYVTVNWYDIWTMKIDGSDTRKIVSNRGVDTREPAWSPDGLWIAYRSCCDPSGYNTWLVRYDGTQDHPLLAAGVAGYPGYTVTYWSGAPVWSPDGKRIGTNFSASSPDGSVSFDGIGTISRDGGGITPVFLAPPGVVCCAQPRIVAWSPDGQSIVFMSGHYLPIDPEWANGKFEPGVELWMTKADGTGDPIRLTYDYTYVEQANWWAPNTAVGKAISIVKGDATATFAEVTRPGSTRINVTPDCPAPAPAGYAFTGDLWNGATTAQYQGGITVALHYDASLVGRESSLALLQWDAAKGKWQDITTRPIDKANRVIRGQCRSLSTFAIAVKTR
jgi:hypothetical protein